MMRIDRSLYSYVVDHCNNHVPEEACGVLAGPADSDELTSVHPMNNVAEHPRARFAFDPDEQLALWFALERAGRRPKVVYHSHVTTAAYPSDTDVRFAVDPTLAHLVVSLVTTPPVGRLFTIRRGVVVQVPMLVVDGAPA